MKDIDRWLREPRRGPVDPDSCVVCASLRGGISASTRMDDPLLALATLSAMRVHKKHGHQDWVKGPEPAAR
ncbi:hypothetical protein [Streptomyces aureus]